MPHFAKASAAILLVSCILSGSVDALVPRQTNTTRPANATQSSNQTELGPEYQFFDETYIMPGGRVWNDTVDRGYGPIPAAGTRIVNGWMCFEWMNGEGGSWAESLVLSRNQTLTTIFCLCRIHIPDPSCGRNPRPAFWRQPGMPREPAAHIVQLALGMVRRCLQEPIRSLGEVPEDCGYVDGELSVHRVWG
jgi:hypothetical protein